MKIQIYSDLHHEFSPFEPPETEADLVVLAGDIDVLGRGVTWANEAFSCPVIYCCGNHEFYKGHVDHTLQKMRDRASPHVLVMENEVWVHKQTRFLVTCAWTDFTSTGDAVTASALCAEWLNDFKVIRAGDSYRRFRPADAVKRNRVAFDFLATELAKPFKGKTVVVTHHCPIPQAAGMEDHGHLNAAYSNRWHALVELADTWIFGHTHHAIDMELSGCRLISNPRGYPGQKTGFNAALTIEV